MSARPPHPELTPATNAIVGEIAALHAAHTRTLELVAALPVADWRIQYHPDLSPLGWHLGHIAFIETYWIREVVLGDARVTAPLHAFYFPELSPKPQRGVGLPSGDGVATFAGTLFRDNRDILRDLLMSPHRHPLLRDAYLAHFLIQHHHQHVETMQMIRQQRLLARDWSDYRTMQPLTAVAPRPPETVCAGGNVRLGHAGGPEPFDNELPQHTIELPAFALGARPVNNAEYLGFMAAGGYVRADWWSTAGRAWLQTAATHAPQHWRRDAAGHWFAIEPEGPAALGSEAAVRGINYYEAQAFAAYAGGRLPQESEWEYAAQRALVFGVGGAWEWCANPFYPYPGFRAFPYAAYSTPWFDGDHYALRGGSRYTHATVRRPTFRNFYSADKRHVFAGLRLAAHRE